MRPARLARLLVNVAGLVDVPLAFGLMFRHAAGRLTAGEADFVPESERHKVYRTARIDLAIYAATIALAIGFRSWLPVLLIGGPRLYGALLLYFYAIYRSPGDEYYATDGHCTHEKTLLCDGLGMGRVIECPKHNGRFDYVSGKALGAPALEDIRTYPVKVADGTVFIEAGFIEAGFIEAGFIEAGFIEAG